MPLEEPKPSLQTTVATASPTSTAAEQKCTQKGKDARIKPYPKKPRRRKRPKDELDYLRTKVSDLEEELTKVSQSAGRLSPMRDEDEELFSRWKQVAERQKEEANRTVVENLKLRAMLEGQLQIARRLETAISDHQLEVARSGPWNQFKPELNCEQGDGHRPPTASTWDEKLFAELNGCLEAQYANVDAKLEESGIASIMQDRAGGIQLLQDFKGISFGHKEVRLLPFSIHSMSRAMWSLLLADKVVNHLGRIESRILNNDHLNATIVDILQLPKSRHTEMTIRIAVRRYFEADRVVLVWSACMEIAGSLFVRLREKGINTVSTFDFLRGGHVATSKISPTGCILRSVMDLKPEAVEFNSRAESRAEVGEMTDLVIGTYHRNFGMLFQIVENLLLNEVMVDSKTSSPPHEPPHKGKNIRTTPYPTMTKRRRRKRPKDELDYLRVQVTSLEEELSKLSAVNGLIDSEGVDDELFTQWKKIAERQKAEADNSTMENLKLRSMLEGQLRVAKSLEAAIQHQQEEAAQLLSKHREIEFTGTAGPRRLRALSMSDDLVFGQLNTGLEAQYAELDMVMNQTGISREFQKSHGISVQRQGTNLTFHHEEARLLPFPMPAVHRAMWSCIRYGKAKDMMTGHVRLRVVNNDHLNATIVDDLKLPGSRTFTTCARLGMRRYFEQDRIVVVWSGCVEVAGSLFVRLHEKGYTSASTFDFSKNASAGASKMDSSVPGCVVRMALQTKPEMAEFDSDQENQGHIGEVTDLVVGTYHRNFGLMYQIIENLLFNDATGGVADDHELERFAAYKDAI
ncbi:hypothetical protein BBO99_00004131 [Phytophthora kernoviae]|uniref:Uncharacterized protein n=2 Tax=Phytophthora kernoviae TaxID=325452 RepID=A0A3R7K093_9STRA|nr:hypothetical protein G195_006280 [Phytophthora kernoviae 00238/432]KAG2523383.1 hypothetical protein JM16_005359 [Phytophthora kernoviae]KAG2525182.1 hypothetical protein JM18_005016 [Phytophthora kernoviae]RLN36543.1 hypothetical protein BBI17_004307 [Phytophthora kernoviae]RLN80950.1 hypothetical protein BBO99_00004131 [Phytophthora kernoviae]